MKRIFSYLKKYFWYYIVGMLTLFVVDWLNAVIPNLTGKVIDSLVIEGIQHSEIWKLLGQILLYAFIISLGRFGWRYFVVGPSKRVERDIRDDLFTHLTKLPMSYYNEHKTGDLMAHFTNDLAAIRMSTGIALVTTFDAVFMTLMIVYQMVTKVDIRLTALACIPMLFIMIGSVLYGIQIEKRFADKQQAFSNLTDRVQENISGIRVIKAFVQERAEIREFDKVNRESRSKNLRVVRLGIVMSAILEILIGASIVITIVYGGYLVTANQISIGQFVEFNEYIAQFVWPMLAVGESINTFSQGIASAKRINKIFDEEPSIVDGPEVKDINKLEGQIDVNHLSFAFNEEAGNVLSDVSVSIKKGETLAVIGKTGSGKTVFANLLLRMYDTEPGMISFDGYDIHEIPLHVLHTQIAYVPQDNFLFSDTIQSNIAFGIRDLKDIPKEKIKIKIFQSKKQHVMEFAEDTLMNKVSIEDKIYDDLEPVTEAAKQACIHDNIVEFKNKYSTMVGERGVTISGGQKQRSSIARALIKDAPILILDDSLSAVDTDTEEKILSNLKEIRKNKTTIIIAHRISTIQNADKIMVLDDGKVIEYGTHAELVRFGGSYARLYEKQQLEKMIEEA